jgi:hypothetical protein
MESIEEKGGHLEDSELYDFIEEIQSEDVKGESTEKTSGEAQDIISELPENAEIEAYYGNDAWRMPPIYAGNQGRITVLYGPEVKQKAAEGRREAAKEKSRRLKNERLRIQREAFSQELISLSDKIETPHIKLLIAALTKEHTRMINRYSSFINNRLTSLLNPFIPPRLKNCRLLYPDSIRMSPGFMYKASKEYGNGLTFWATPLIPYYFAQNTEQAILLKNKPTFLYSIDKAVGFYHWHLKQRQEKELRYASAVIQKGVSSYYDLLKFNPFWFEVLYNELKNKQDD